MKGKVILFCHITVMGKLMGKLKISLYTFSRRGNLYEEENFNKSFLGAGACSCYTYNIMHQCYKCNIYGWG